MTPGVPLRNEQQRAVEVLLAGGTIDDAAVAAGVTSRTINRWRHDPGVRVALERGRNLILEDVATKMAAAAGIALNKLIEVITEPASAQLVPVYVRVNAAKAILDAVPRWTTDAEIIRRLDDLEEQLATPPALRSVG